MKKILLLCLALGLCTTGCSKDPASDLAPQKGTDDITADTKSPTTLKALRITFINRVDYGGVPVDMSVHVDATQYIYQNGVPVPNTGRFGCNEYQVRTEYTWTVTQSWDYTTPVYFHFYLDHWTWPIVDAYCNGVRLMPGQQLPTIPSSQDYVIEFRNGG